MGSLLKDVSKIKKNIYSVRNVYCDYEEQILRMS